MSKWATQLTWDETAHLSNEAKSALIASIPPNQRDARTKGIPQLGAGAIYPVPESDFAVEPFELPAYWPKAYSLDVGWNRTAALFGAHDPEADVIYFYAEHYRSQAEPAVHAAAIKARAGDWMNGVIDPASRGRAQKDGEQLLSLYVDLGLRLSTADNGVEAGIYDFWERLSTGRIKAFKTLVNFFAEYRIYRRDERGRIVKENDHLMDCGRYWVRSGLASAVVNPLAYVKPAGRDHAQAGYDPFEQFYQK